MAEAKKDEIMKVTIFVNRQNHASIKELAKRRRVQLGNIYDQATSAFLKLPANYMSMKQSARLRKVQ